MDKFENMLSVCVCGKGMHIMIKIKSYDSYFLRIRIFLLQMTHAATPIFSNFCTTCIHFILFNVWKETVFSPKLLLKGNGTSFSSGHDLGTPEQDEGLDSRIINCWR